MTAADLIDKLLLRRKRAEATLEDPGLVEAFEAVREAAIKDFATSSPAEGDKRDDAYLRLRGLALIRKELGEAIERHKLAVLISERTTNRNAAN